MMYECGMLRVSGLERVWLYVVTCMASLCCWGVTSTPSMVTSCRARLHIRPSHAISSSCVRPDSLNDCSTNHQPQ